MGNRGRLIAPGGLRDELAAVAEDGPTAGESLAEMAAQYGLRPSSARPRLVSYLVKVWQRRHFILAYATARNVSMYTEARLGQLWQVLTPLLNSAVYYLIFGVLFKANRGISNYTAYLAAADEPQAFASASVAAAPPGSGIQARSAVPAETGLLICIAPFSAPMRSRSPIRPLVSSRASAPPIPSSRTSIVHRSSSTATCTRAELARACLTTLVSASEQRK
jgi:hypothetical protein